MCYTCAPPRKENLISLRFVTYNTITAKNSPVYSREGLRTFQFPISQNEFFGLGLITY